MARVPLPLLLQLLLPQLPQALLALWREVLPDALLQARGRGVRLFLPASRRGCCHCPQRHAAARAARQRPPLQRRLPRLLPARSVLLLLLLLLFLFLFLLLLLLLLLSLLLQLLRIVDTCPITHH